MIVYFSATGNCKYVEERIAKETKDTAVSIETIDTAIDCSNSKLFGIITPTYYWGLAGPMRDWLKRLSVTGSAEYCFVVATYGTTPGCTGEEARRLLKDKGVEMNAVFSIKMPDTWTPMFDLSDPETVARQNEYAETEIESVIQSIQNRTTGNRMDRKVPYAIHPIAQLYENHETKTKNFRVEESCIGCGLCVRRCPMHAIEMREKKPVWVKDHCAACLRCLHHCPKFAIQYGSHTAAHGQYRNPHTSV